MLRREERDSNPFPSRNDFGKKSIREAKVGVGYGVEAKTFGATDKFISMVGNKRRIGLLGF